MAEAVATKQEKVRKVFSFTRVIRGSFIVFLTVAVFTTICSSSFSAEPTVTPVFIFIYGYGPLEVGDEVVVYTKEGVICGKTVVEVKGQYGQMAVYGDDPLTGDVVEGARQGENLLIKINGGKVHLPKGGASVFGRDGETYRVDLCS